ncbi:MAG: ADP-ribosylglycohydrolase family protein [Candidatus Latescibacteria bacterium]|nr:ADP-ribosylglycohydrolase family protein [Candidatus Latescibacterota bacterium]
MKVKDHFLGCLLGLACGDAVGTTVEFRPRGSFEPVTDMVGGGPFSLEPGQWTDDTSMALCLATSLVERGFDPHDQMDRYCRWWEEGYLSSTGRCFDIGNATRAALSRFRKTGEPFSGSTDPNSAGNGCLMRLAPVPMFFFPDHRAVVRFSGESSRTTHGAAECIDACRLFGSMLFKALSGQPKEEILFGDPFPGWPEPPLANRIQAIAGGAYRSKSEHDIRGSGYVVESLEAALWCFYHTDSFRDAILKAVNLGDDADTTGAICGQIAGACYGEDGIPEAWKQRLVMHDRIVELAEKLLQSSDGTLP